MHSRAAGGTIRPAATGRRETGLRAAGSTLPTRAGRTNRKVQPELVTADQEYVCLGQLARQNWR